VPRYFFTIRARDRLKNDPCGTNLPDVAAALSSAECKIRDLRKQGGYALVGVGRFTKPGLPNPVTGNIQERCPNCLPKWSTTGDRVHELLGKRGLSSLAL
jgi:hypothetical protein